MSRLGKQSVKIPAGVTVAVQDGTLRIKGPKGELEVHIPSGVKAETTENGVLFELLGSSKQARSDWGTVRALAKNAVAGVAEGFEKTLVLEGVGYRITKEGENLSLNIGFSHPVKYATPAGIAFEVEKNSILKIKGIDRQKVGQVAAEIRALKKPEPYKGKGFRYSDESIRRKAGKKAAAATSGAA